MSGRSGRHRPAHRTPSHDSRELAPVRRLARRLHLLALATAGAVAGSLGCLVTDPVPYEPAENLPPLVNLQDRDLTISPLGIVERQVACDGTSCSLDDPDSLLFTIPIIEWNTSDSLQYRVILYTSDTSSPNGSLIAEGTVPSTPTRERELTFSIDWNDGRLLGRRCSTVMLAISDAGWGNFPPYWKQPVDAQGEPRTIPILIRWLLWIKDPRFPDTLSEPPVGSCGTVQ